jgi:hypothetical protein
MAAENLEKRVAALEAEVAALKSKVNGAPPEEKEQEHWVKKWYGAFEGSQAFKEAMEYGRKYRESLRPKPRKSKRRAK